MKTGRFTAVCSEQLRRLAILIAVFSLVFSCAGADSLFSLAATRAPEPAATPAPKETHEPVRTGGTLFAALATASPSPVPTPSPVPMPSPEPTASPEQTVPEETATPGPTAAPGSLSGESDAGQETEVCSHCNHGLCRICDGLGYEDYELCCGTGICGVCFGKPQKYVPGYGLGGTYVTCRGCNGSGRCSFCEGTGRRECRWCDGGVCDRCHGNYLIDPREP